MTDSPGQRIAGTLGPRFRQAMAVPQEDMATKLARALGAFGNTQTGMPTPAYEQPFTGLRNQSQTLPPFVPPGNAMTEAIGPGVPFTPPTPAPAPTAALPSPTAAVQPQTLPGAAPAPPQLQATPAQGGDQTVKADVMAAVQQMLAANLLPEQWKGAFTTPQGMPR